MLNDTRIRSAKPAERDYKLTDFDGLYLLVRPNGRRQQTLALRLPLRRQAEADRAMTVLIRLAGGKEKRR
jgi:hypothetical protein